MADEGGVFGVGAWVGVCLWGIVSWSLIGVRCPVGLGGWLSGGGVLGRGVVSDGWSARVGWCCWLLSGADGDGRR